MRVAAFSPQRRRRIATHLAAAGCALLALTACKREERRFRDAALPNPAGVVVDAQLHPGGGAPPPPPANPYENNAFALSEGKRLFSWYNCVGCHAHGGGGMGPPLMDDVWIYGNQPAQIYASIVEGRPNGMPAFAGKIPDQEVWELVAYVRSLSGQVRMDVAGGRDDHMQVKPAEQAMEQVQPKGVAEPQPPP
jgi:cytochrome c oxidase cbb3-type subunit 3